MSLVHNEQTTLTAMLLNSLAVAAIAPTAAFIVGAATMSAAAIGGGVWRTIGLALHLMARASLRTLKE